MSMMNKIKQFSLTYVPGMKAVRDIRRAILDYREMKPRVDELSERLEQWKNILNSGGINNTHLYSDIIYKRFDLQSPLLKLSKSQLDQDLFVSYLLKEKTEGFFVEFGATNGVDLSNSYLLEKQLNWQGILAEPGRSWHEKLHENRSCKIDMRCVYSLSGQKISFSDSVEPELSTISAYVNSDAHAVVRKNSIQYEVETISLNDLLEFHCAPKEIDYLSIDTEGSELEILNAFDFSRYDTSIITVEHNYTENRKKIHSLLSRNGYERVFEQYSQFDDWYVKKDKIGRDISL